MDIKVGDTLCLIKKVCYENGEEKYKVYTDTITKIVIGKNKTSVKCKHFRGDGLDLDFLESATMFWDKGLILVDEIFVDRNNSLKRAERWCESKNREMQMKKGKQIWTQ